MLKRPAIAPPLVVGVLHTTDRTLGAVIGSTLGVAPSLELVAQWRLDAPYPSWVSPPFAPDSPILGRCTGYRVDGSALSHNLAYVDLAQVEPDIAEGLQSGRVHLGELFLDPAIERFAFEFGQEDEVPELLREYERHLGGRQYELRPFVWRRYLAGVGGAPTFVVIEALPIASWGDLINADGRGAAGSG